MGEADSRQSMEDNARGKGSVSGLCWGSVEGTSQGNKIGSELLGLVLGPELSTLRNRRR